MTQQKVGIIHNRPLEQGEPNWESSADVLDQVKAIQESLQALGHSSVTIPFGRDLSSFIEQVRREKISHAFNLCESVDEDPLLIGHPAAVLDLLGISYTGSPAAALMLTTDKLMMKRLMKAAGIRTPNFITYDGGAVEVPAAFTFPAIIKPRFQDASIGIDQESIARTGKELQAKLKVFYTKHGPLLVEEFIAGLEFNISLFGWPRPRVMPIAEIDFSGFPSELYQIVGYKAKWDASSVEYQQTKRFFPQNLPVLLERNMRKVSLECFNQLGLRDYGRVDVRVDELARVYVLEVNANPCLSRDAGFAAAVGTSRMSYVDMVQEFLHIVTQRMAI